MIVYLQPVPETKSNVCDSTSWQLCNEVQPSIACPTLAGSSTTGLKKKLMKLEPRTGKKETKLNMRAIKHRSKKLCATFSEKKTLNNNSQGAQHENQCSTAQSKQE